VSGFNPTGARVSASAAVLLKGLWRRYRSSDQREIASSPALVGLEDLTAAQSI
jgi:hypothetical protein